MPNLTEKQLATLAFINDYHQRTGTVPTFGTIGKFFKITAQAAYGRFRQLVSRGYIKIEPGVQQGYELL